MRKNDGRGDWVWQRTTSISGQDGEGFGVTGIDTRGGLGVQLSNGRGDVVALRVASARASNLWEGGVKGSIVQGGTGNMGGGTKSGGVNN